MILYPSIKKVIPILVVGPQRSGTRFITNVLNSNPRVTIQDEIPDSIILKIFEVIQECNQKFGESSKIYRRKNWEATKSDFMFSVWTNLTQGKRKQINSDCKYFGYKTPFHEKYFDFYNHFFHPVRPKYICCVRSFMDHYFSVHARWPDRSIINVAKRYTNSLRNLRYMKEKRHEDVLFFFLDDFKKEGVPYLQEKIFTPLALENISPAMKKAAQRPENTSSKLGLKKKNTLNLLQDLSLKFYPYPFKEYENLRNSFG